MLEIKNYQTICVVLKEPPVRMKRKETMRQKTEAKHITKIKHVLNEENKSEVANVNNEICDFG
jgi:hypothetical protein